ncbi:MAG: tetratricopeptide repeat protein [Chloroflexi bacterium]|nr:tetratricopeptide repeat protein [Chloroflexota bacterium]
MKRSIAHRLLLLIVLILGTAGATVFVLASARYGGPTGLVLRVQAEINGRRPRDLYVPTPLPTNGDQPGEATAGPLLAATATLALSPTPAPSATETAHSTAGDTPQPTATITLTPTPEPTPTLAFLPAAPAVELTGFRHAWQTWNNCAPATLAMALSYYGKPLTQADIGDVLRPNKEDKHVGGDELVEFARGQGLQAILRVNGTPDLLRTLLSNGLPVMIATWHEDKPNDGMGHYRLVVGYDDAREEWVLYDSLAGEGTDRNAPYVPLRMSYARLAEWWAVMNHKYIVIYADEMAPTVEAILGGQMDDATMWAQALADSKAAVEQHPEDPFAAFNLGSNLVGLKRYQEAAAAYDKARTIGLPWRMLWYQFGPFEAYYGAGRYQEVIALADATLDVTIHVEELHYWKGLALAATGQPEAARRSLQRALELKPGYPAALAALNALGSGAISGD